MSPAGWWGRGRERKIPIKSGHCLEPGMGLRGGNPPLAPRPRHPGAQMKGQLYPPQPRVGGDADPKTCPSGSGGRHGDTVYQRPDPLGAAGLLSSPSFPRPL